MKARGLLVLLFTASVLFAASAQTQDLILVLGTSSHELSDVEDRVLREEVMRQLVIKGNQVVSVMALEREIQERLFVPSLLGDREAFALADRLGAHWIIRGSMTSGSNLKTYLLFVYNNETHRRYETTITFTDDEFPNYCQTLAQSIALKTKELIDDAGKR
jgi:hypothetical protein